MKKAFRKAISVLLVAVMVFGTAPLAGFMGLELPEFNLFSTKAEAATEGYYTYSVLNGEAAITDVDASISGDIIIPSTLGGYPVTSIDGYAFYYRTSLESITIPDRVTSIGYAAFRNCTSLESVTIGKGVTSIGVDVFHSCESLENVYYTGDVAGWCAIDFASYAYHPMSYADNLYINGGGLTKGNLVIPDSVTTIGDYTFYSCDNISSVTIPDSVTSIGDMAFCHCENLVKATLGNSVTSIGDKAFYSCENLSSIEIPDSVTSIGEEAFRYCYSLKSITIGKGVTSIGSSAFSGCSGVKSITVDAANTAYVSDKYGVLFDKDKTILIQYPMGSSTTKYTIPDSVKTIGRCAFEGSLESNIYTYSLKSVTIPNSVITIEDSAFDCCRSLTSIDIPDSVKTIGGWAFFGCARVSELKIGGGVEEIGEYAFAGLLLLTDVVFREGITTLESGTFYLCSSVRNVSLPRSIEFIKAGTFSSCSNIKNVYYAGSKSEWEEVVVGGNNGSFSAARLHYNSIGSSIIGGSTDDPDNTPDYDSAIVDTYLMPTPTETKISYGDSIVLHVDSAKIPEGGKVEWYPSNESFSYSVSADGTTCTITPNKSGDTTFTAIVYDTQGNIVSADKQEMTSKAGFFDKLIAFFKKLFGLTKTIPEAIKSIY